MPWGGLVARPSLFSVELSVYEPTIKSFSILFSRSSPPLGERVENEEVAILYSLKKGGPGKRRGVRHYFVLYEGWSQLTRSMDGEVVVKELIDRWTAALAGSLHMATLFTAPGIVVEKDGKALAVVGAPQDVAADCLSYCAAQGFNEVSRRAVVFNLEGAVLPFPETLPETDLANNSPKYKLDEVVFLEEIETPAVVSPGQGALKFLKGCLGNATVWGELLGLSKGFEGAVCRVAPKSSGVSAIIGRN